MPIVEIKKGCNLQLSKHIHSQDVHCNCHHPDCVVTYYDSEHLASVQKFFDLHGYHRINSWYRCSWWNKENGGKPGSFHLLGKATDLEALYDETGAELARKALDVPAFHHGGIGTYKTFIHVDSRGYKARWNG